jgi:dephospho-CoA kinase
MTHDPQAKIIAFVGLPGAGKSEAVEYLADKGYPKVYGGGLIVEGVKKLGLAVNPENEKKYREEMRATHGPEVFIKMAAEQMQNLISAGQRYIVFDGLYTWTEYKYLKHEFPGELIVVAIVAPKHLRHHRLTMRPIRPLTIEESNERDWAEIENLEKGGPIAIADHFIANDKSLDDLHNAIDAELAFFHFAK